MEARAFRSAAAITFSLALGTVTFAQSPTPQQTPSTPPQTQQAPKPATPRQGGMDHLQSLNGKTVTLTGCLMQEKHVAGQTPNPAERLDAAPDYILTNVQMRSTAPAAAGATGKTGTPGTTGSTGTTGTTGTTATPETGNPPSAGAHGATDAHGAAGAGAMAGLNVKLSSVDNDQMRSNLNRQVEVTGRLSVDAKAAGHTARDAQVANPSTAQKVRDNVLGDNNKLPELQVSAVRATGQACTPAKQ